MGGHYCECTEGYQRGRDGTCKDFSPMDCGVSPVEDDIKSMSGQTVHVRVSDMTSTFVL